MPRALIAYVRLVDRISDYVGYVAASLIFLMAGTLIFDAFTRNAINMPVHWAIELTQFTLAAYYFLGGPITLKNDDHVRMDLFYSDRSPRTRAWIDLVTSACLIFYLVAMMIGAVSSLNYAIATDERRFSIWNPSVIPIKSLMVAALGLMLLQALSLVLKHIATLRGEEIA